MNVLDFFIHFASDFVPILLQDFRNFRRIC
jgi:hypothetical protein